MDDLKFDADKSFNDAMKTMGCFLKDHEEEGQSQGLEAKTRIV